jgi:elongation factor 1-gamma
LDYISTEVEPVFVKLILSVLGWAPLDAATLGKATHELITKLKVLDARLQNNKYLLGNTLTIADINAFTNVSGSFSHVLNEHQRKGLPNLVRWVEELFANQAFRNFFGRPRFLKHAFPVS